MKQQLIKCPICGTLQPIEVDFCVYCNTEFDKNKIEILDLEESEDRP